MRQRILSVSHGHPDFSYGGGEVAAYNLYLGYKEISRVEASFLLAVHKSSRGVTGDIYKRRPSEYLWEQYKPNYFRMSMLNTKTLESTLKAFLDEVKPTVVHAHHYWPMGLEYLCYIRQTQAPLIVLTLHEMQAICYNNGQMIKTDGNRLCFSESPEDCHRCFPDISEESFWLRKQRYLRFLDYVDHFISPSHFIKERYANWGIDSSRISVLENAHVYPREIISSRRLQDGETRSTYGYFGQINPYKGVDVLLKAIALLPASATEIKLYLHGANLDKQPAEFQRYIMALLTPLIDSHNVFFEGPYYPFQLQEKMSKVDWILVPSIWWENSPMVIQEAFACGRPVIASDVGGMAEKVRHNINGILVEKNNVEAWSKAILQTSQYSSEWDRLVDSIEPRKTLRDSAEEHLDLFSRL